MPFTPTKGRLLSSGVTGLNDSNKNTPKKYIYVLLTDYPNRISKVIKRIGLWKYSHVSISTSDKFPNFFSFTGKRGFMIEEPHLHPKYKGLDVPCALYRIPAKPQICQSVENKIQQFVDNSHLYKYSYFELAKVYLRIKSKPKKKPKFKYTCTGFVGKLLKEESLAAESRKHALLSPNDFMYTFKEHKVFEGTLEKMLGIAAARFGFKTVRQ